MTSTEAPSGIATMKQEENGNTEVPKGVEYLTLEQAAEDLSERINDKVNEVDVLSIVLEDLLKLSVNIPIYTPAKHYKKNDIRTLPAEINNYFSEIELSGDENIVLIKGYFDLCLEEGGVNAVEYIIKCIRLGYITQKTTSSHRYIYVENPTNGQKYQLQELANLYRSQYNELDIWCPTESLPNKSRIWVRKSALDELDELKVKEALENLSTLESVYNREEDLARGSFNPQVKPLMEENEHLDTEAESSPQDTQQNYFIYHNKRWRVRFQGGADGSVKDCVAIRVLLEYIRKPFEEVSATKVHAALTGKSSSVESLEKEQLNETTAQELGKDESRVIDKNAKDEIQKALKEFLIERDRHKRDGDINKAELSQEEFLKYKKIIENEYKGVKIKDNGTIIVYNKAVLGRDIPKEYVKARIKEAMKLIEEEGLKDLSDHLKKYLQKNTMYSPTDCIPGWFIQEPPSK